MRTENGKITLMGFLYLISCIVLTDCTYREVGILPDIDISGSPNGIVAFPEETPSIITDVFSKYTKIMAPNGKPIHFIAQDDWTDDKILKVRNIMEHMLTDFPGSQYGSNKALVVNNMADNKATMTLFNSSEDARIAREGPFRNGTDLFTQSMWATEITVEGGEDYMNHITRDAGFEEIWHLVHESGKSILPEFQAEIEAAKDAAVEIGWGPPNDDPDSWDSEYYAQQYDNYLDLWAVTPKVWEGRNLKPGEVPEGTAHFGQNQVNNREELKELDPVGYELIEKFFHPYLTYTVLLPVDFQGPFKLEFDESLVYTHKSQHLKDVTMRGNNDASLVGNDYDNVFRGNAGNNTFQGGKGLDRLNGGEGEDAAIYSGLAEEYLVSVEGGTVTVTDKLDDRDGQDTLTQIEFLVFKDKKVEL